MDREQFLKAIENLFAEVAELLRESHEMAKGDVIPPSYEEMCGQLEIIAEVDALLNRALEVLRRGDRAEILLFSKELDRMRKETEGHDQH